MISWLTAVPDSEIISQASQGSAAQPFQILGWGSLALTIAYALFRGGRSTSNKIGRYLGSQVDTASEENARLRKEAVERAERLEKMDDERRRNLENEVVSLREENLRVHTELSAVRIELAELRGEMKIMQQVMKERDERERAAAAAATAAIARAHADAAAALAKSNNSKEKAEQPDE